MPTLQEQLRRDLHHRVDDRLFQWIKDSLALYEMADLSTADVLEDVFMSLFSCIGALSASYNLEHEPIVNTFRKCLELSQRKYSQEESR